MDDSFFEQPYSHQQAVFAAQPAAHSAASHSFGQPYFQAEPVETAAPFGSLFDKWHSQHLQPCSGQQPTVVTAELVGSGSEFGSEYEDDSGSAAAQCLGQPQKQAACFEQAMTADTSKRLKPTHPQPTEVSDCLCPAAPP